ncbi:hypothetical protein BH23THE1_BH23THE1_27430 [soil metagenome]
MLFVEKSIKMESIIYVKFVSQISGLINRVTFLPEPITTIGSIPNY